MMYTYERAQCTVSFGTPCINKQDGRISVTFPKYYRQKVQNDKKFKIDSHFIDRKIGLYSVDTLITLLAS